MSRLKIWHLSQIQHGLWTQIFETLVEINLQNFNLVIDVFVKIMKSQITRGETKLNPLELNSGSCKE